MPFRWGWGQAILTVCPLLLLIFQKGLSLCATDLLSRGWGVGDKTKHIGLVLDCDLEYQ